MHVENGKGQEIQDDGEDTEVFFMAQEVVYVNLEDGRTVQIDRHGNFLVYRDRQTIQAAAFPY